MACRAASPAGRCPAPPVPSRPVRAASRARTSDAARSALRDWGVMRPLTVSDAERASAAVDPTSLRA